MARSVIEITTGCAGTGKTFRRCAHFLVDDFLVNESGKHYSNFPINIRPLTREVLSNSSNVKNRTRRSLLEQINIIPQSELDLWAIEASGPWEYFSDLDLQDAHISIDEAHNFIGVDHSKTHKAKWKSWLGELRHSGATIEFLTQNEMKLDMCVKRDAELMRTLENQEQVKDPFFNIEMFYWYELRASFLTGVYTVFIKEIDRKRQTGNKWIDVDSRLFYRHPKYFKFYDSYSAPQESRKQGGAKLKEFESRSKINLLWWFVSRNITQLFIRLAVIVFIFYIMTGGTQHIMKGVLSMFSGLTDKARNNTTLNNDLPIKESKEEIFKVNQAKQGLSPSIKSNSSGNISPEDQLSINHMSNLNLLRQELKLVKENNINLRKLIVLESEIVLLTKNSFTLANGFSFELGEVIDIGFLKGMVGISIDWERRLVRFKNGKKIRIGSVGIDSGDFGLSTSKEDLSGKATIQDNL